MSYHYYTDFQQIIALMFGDKRTNFALTKGEAELRDEAEAGEVARLVSLG